MVLCMRRYGPNDSNITCMEDDEDWRSMVFEIRHLLCISLEIHDYIISLLHLCFPPQMLLFLRRYPYVGQHVHDVRSSAVAVFFFGCPERIVGLEMSPLPLLLTHRLARLSPLVAHNPGLADHAFCTLDILLRDSSARVQYNRGSLASSPSESVTL